mgnify:CR=1 FL=1
MVFSSLVFLFLFLPICLIAYFLSPTLKIKNLVLLAFSIFFYAWGEPIWVFLLIFSGTVDFVIAKIIDKNRDNWKSKFALIASLTINLGLLGFFKYGNFIVENINALFNMQIPLSSMTLPIGISFYTFQTLSYSIDVYRNEVKVQKSFSNFQLFVALFPQLIAGPILRYSELEAQLNDRTSTLEKTSQGISRFLIGLGKKVLIANYVGEIATTILDGGLVGLPVIDAWFGVLMFTFQIYFDFSGYSDMAIGLGKIFGFEYGENFNYPYISKSITEFWRRWHISLGSFFRDYVYIPLGGNRSHQFRNIVVVWFLTGLWHGASWNFVLWGMYFAVLLILEKYIFKGIMSKLPKALSWSYTFILVMIGWVLFYYTDLTKCFALLKIMFGLAGHELYNANTIYTVSSRYLIMIISALASTPIVSFIKKNLETIGNELPHFQTIRMTFVAMVNLVIIFLCTTSLIGQSFNPFLYFRF